MTDKNNTARRVGLVLLAFLVTFGGVVGSVGFVSAAAGGPVLDSAVKGETAKEINVTITDDFDVNETSITQSDFAVNKSSVSRISTVDSGNNTIVTLTLTDFVDADEVEVTLQSGETINDSDGNSLTGPVTVVAGNMDGVAPTYEGASKVDDTHIEVNISDGVDVNESTISAEDFHLTVGTVVSVATSDSDGNVTLELDEAVDASSIDVNLSASGAIEDTSGNTLTDSGPTYTVDNMDGVAPAVTAVTVTQDGGDDTVTTGDTVNVTADVADGGSGIGTVEVNASALGGSNTLTLTDADSDGTYNGTFQVSSPTADDGAVSLTVNATDNNGNFNDTESDSVTLDTTGPAASNFDPADGETVTTKQPTLGVDLTDATSVNASSISVTVNNTDGSKTYFDGVGTSETGVSYSSNHLSVDLSTAGVTLDEKQVTVEVTVADEDTNAATHVWNFTVDAADKKSGSDDWGRDDDDDETTEEPPETTTESDDSTDDADDGSDESTPSTTETADDVTTADATAESTGTSAATEASDATDADGETTATGVPGFGALVAVVALLAAALLARRES